MTTEQIFESNLEDDNSLKFETLIKSLKEEDYDPRGFLAESFSYTHNKDEDELINLMMNQLTLINKDVNELDRKITKEEENLKMELDVSQINCNYEIDHFLNEFRDVKDGIKTLTGVIGHEEEQIRTVGEEMRELNNSRNEKIMLRELVKVLDIYQEDSGERRRVMKIEIENGSTEMLVKLDCLKSSLETLNFEEYKEVKKMINDDYQLAKDNTLKNFEKMIKDEKYKEASILYNFMKRSGNLEETESVYVKLLIDVKQIYPLTDISNNIDEFKRTLFKMIRQLEQIENKEGIFWNVHKNDSFDIVDRVMLKIMREYICDMASSLLGQCVEGGKTDFFLTYLDSMTLQFNQFQQKAKKMESVWSILESINEAYKDIVEKYQGMYFEIEKNQLKSYLESTVALNLMEIKKVGVKENDEESIKFTKILIEIVRQLKESEIEQIINKAKESFLRCMRNSLAHNMADNCGDMLILFMNQITNYISKLIELTEENAPSTSEKDPARIELFGIVQSVLKLIKRIDLLFGEFKETITNIFKLDEADKTRQQIMKILSEKISMTLNLAMRNLFAQLSQIWKTFKKKKKKKKDSLGEESKLAKSIDNFLGKYLDFIFDKFSIDQKTNLFKVIGVEFMKFLERMIPQEKYSQNDLLQLNVDIEFYTEGLIEFLEEDEVSEKMETLKALVGLLQLPWDILEVTLEENDVFKSVEKHTLDNFIKCIKRMSKKKKKK